MSAKSIYENQGKSIIFRTIKNKNLYQQKSVVINENSTDLEALPEKYPFLNKVN